LTKLKRKRRPLKKRRLPMNHSVNSLRKFWVIRLKKLLLDPDWMNHHVFWSLENTDGPQTWKES